MSHIRYVCYFLVACCVVASSLRVHAQSVEPECVGHAAVIIVSANSTHASFAFNLNAEPVTDDVRIVIHSMPPSAAPIIRAMATIPSRLLVFTPPVSESARPTWSLVWLWSFGTAIGDADDVTALQANYLRGTVTDASVALSVNFRTIDGCDTSSGFTSTFSLAHTHPTSLQAPVLSTAIASAGVIRDTDELVVNARTTQVPTAPLFVYADVPPLPDGTVSSECTRFGEVVGYKLRMGQSYVDGLASMRTGVARCLCTNDRTRRAFCQDGTVAVVADFTAALVSTVRNASTGVVTTATVWSPPSAYQISFGDARRVDAEVVSVAPALSEPDCRYTTHRLVYRRGDTLRIVCDFPELPTVAGASLYADASDRLGFFVDALFTPVPGPGGVAHHTRHGRRVWRREFAWVVGTTLIPATTSDLAVIRANAAIVSGIRNLAFVMRYNFRLGSDTTKVFYGASSPMPRRTGVHTASLFGTANNATLVDVNAVGPSFSSIPNPSACTVVMTAPGGTPARANDVVSTRLVCDIRVQRTDVALLTRPSGVGTTSSVCATTTDLALPDSIRPVWTTTFGSFSMEWSFDFRVRGAGIFGDASCVAAVDGTLQSRVTVYPRGGFATVTLGEFALAGSRPRSRFSITPVAVTGNPVNPVLATLSGVLASAQTSVVIEFTPASVYTGAGRIPSSPGVFTLNLGSALSGEIDTYSRAIWQSNLTAASPSFDPFSSRPYTVRVFTGDTSIPGFTLVNASFVFAPRAAPVTVTTSPTTSSGLVSFADDVATSQYWVWYERNASAWTWVHVFSQVVVLQSAHTEVRTSDLVSFRYNVPLYHTPQSLGVYVAQQFALQPDVRAFPLVASNLRVMLALEPKVSVGVGAPQRTRSLQLWSTSLDGVRSTLNTVADVVFSESSVFVSPDQSVSIASPVAGSAWVGSIGFVVAYRATQAPSTVHALTIFQTGSSVALVTLVCKRSVPSVTVGGAYAFDLRGDDLEAGGDWELLTPGVQPALVPGFYTFAITASTGVGGALSVATVTNVWIDSATTAPLQVTSNLDSFSGEIRDRSVIRLGFTPSEDLSRVVVVFRRLCNDTSVPPSADPSLDLRRITLPPTVGSGVTAVFPSGVRVTPNLVMTDSIVQTLSPGQSTTAVEVFLECTDAGLNAPIRVIPVPVGSWTSGYVARPGVVDFESTVRMKPRVISNVGVPSPRVAGVVLRTNFPLASATLELIPVEPLAATHVPSPSATAGPFTTPVPRSFSIVTTSSGDDDRLTALFDLNLEAVQTSVLINPKPPNVGVLDGTYVVRFTLTTGSGGPVYIVNQTSPLVVDTRTQVPTLSDCRILRANSTHLGVVPATLNMRVVIRDIIGCRVSLPEAGTQVTFDLLDAVVGGSSPPRIASAVVNSSMGLDGTYIAWRVGTPFGSSIPGASPWAQNVSSAHGLMNRRVSLRVSYRDAFENAVSVSEPSMTFDLFADQESFALSLSSAVVSSYRYTRLVYEMEDSVTADLYVFATTQGMGPTRVIPFARSGIESTLVVPPPSVFLNGTQVNHVSMRSGTILLMTSIPWTEGISSQPSPSTFVTPETVVLADGVYRIEIRSQSLMRSKSTTVVLTASHVSENPVVVSSVTPMLDFRADSATRTPVIVRNTVGEVVIGSVNQFSCTAPETLVNRRMEWLDSQGVVRVGVPIPDDALCFVEWVIGQQPRDSFGAPFVNVTGAATDVTGSVSETLYARVSGEDLYGNPRATSLSIVFAIDGEIESPAPTLLQPSSGLIVGRASRTFPLSYSLPADPAPGSVLLFFNRQPDLDGTLTTPVTHVIRMSDARIVTGRSVSLDRASQVQDTVTIVTPIVAPRIEDGRYQVTLSYRDNFGGATARARTENPCIVDTIAIPPVVSVLLAGATSIHPRRGEPVFNVDSGIRLRIASLDTTIQSRFRLIFRYSPLAGHLPALSAGSASVSLIGAVGGFPVVMKRGLVAGATTNVVVPILGGDSLDTASGSVALPDGNYTVQVVYSDHVENVAPDTFVASNIIVDTRTLPVRLVSPITGQSFTTGSAVPIQYVLDPNERYSSVRMFFVASSGVEYVYDMNIGSGAAFCSWDTSDELPSITIPLCFTSGGSLPNGIYDIVVVAIDVNQNTPVESRASSVTIMSRTDGGDGGEIPDPDVTTTRPPLMTVLVNDAPVAANATSPVVVSQFDMVVCVLSTPEAAAIGTLRLEMFVGAQRVLTIRPSSMRVSWLIGSRIPGDVLFELDDQASLGRVSGAVTLVFSYEDERRNPRASVTSPTLVFATESTGGDLLAPVYVSLLAEAGTTNQVLRVFMPSAVSGSTSYTIQTALPYSATRTVPASRFVDIPIRFVASSGVYVDQDSTPMFRRNGTHTIEIGYSVGSAEVSVEMEITLISFAAPAPPPPVDTSSSGDSALDQLQEFGIPTVGSIAGAGLVWWLYRRWVRSRVPPV